MESGRSNVSSKLLDSEANYVENVPIALSYQGRCRQNLLPGVKIITSIIAHVVFVTCVLILCTHDLGFIGNDERVSALFLTITVVAAVSYLVFLIEAATSDVYKALQNYTGKISAQSYFERLRNARPQIRWKAECYHYACETDSRTPEARRMKSRVVTGMHKEAFQFCDWRDYTRDIKALLHKPVILFECSKVFIFKDEQSKRQYLQQYQAFRERTRRRDEFMEHEEEFFIPDFHRDVLACSEETNRPCWLSVFVFWVCTMLLLTWPYRIVFKRKSCKVHVAIIKQLEA